MTDECELVHEHLRRPFDETAQLGQKSRADGSVDDAVVAREREGQPLAGDDSDGFAELAPVGSFPAGRTPDGIDDLAGNVEEWVGDAIDDFFGAHYPATSEINPHGAPAGAYRVIRGGAYGGGYEGTMAWQRGAARIFRPASERRTFRGFRCVHPVAEGL